MLFFLAGERGRKKSNWNVDWILNLNRKTDFGKKFNFAEKKKKCFDCRKHVFQGALKNIGREMWQRGGGSRVRLPAGDDRS